MSWAFARSPKARSFACVVFASFWDCGPVLPPVRDFRVRGAWYPSSGPSTRPWTIASRVVRTIATRRCQQRVRTRTARVAFLRSPFASPAL